MGCVIPQSHPIPHPLVCLSGCTGREFLTKKNGEGTVYVFVNYGYIVRACCRALWNYNKPLGACCIGRYTADAGNCSRYSGRRWRLSGPPISHYRCCWRHRCGSGWCVPRAAVCGRFRPWRCVVWCDRLYRDEYLGSRQRSHCAGCQRKPSKRPDDGV